MSDSSTTPDDLYTYADDDDLFVADSATVLELLAALGRPFGRDGAVVNLVLEDRP